MLGPAIRTAAILLVLVPAAHLSAAEPAQSTELNLLPPSLPPHASRMSLTPIDQSMADLLKEGYEVANVAAGFTGVIYTLRRGPSWISCNLGQYGKVEDRLFFTQCEQIS